MMFRTRKLPVSAALTLTTLATVVALALALTHAPSAGAKARPTVKLAQTSLGTILVNGSGMTLYAFTRDGRNTDRCLQISGCTSVWPMLTSAKKPTAGPGVKASLLGSIKLPHRSVRQVTYAGHPLYTYSGDSTPASTFYVGASQFGGTWPALDAAGRTRR
jgi:predicted lipoprotein with Yx(FWY)xxD motif